MRDRKDELMGLYKNIASTHLNAIRKNADHEVIYHLEKARDYTERMVRDVK